VKGDCRDLPFKDNQFDVVLSQGLIEHFKRPKKIILEHIRTCKPGVVLISVPFRYSYHFLWWWITRNRYLKRFWPWMDQEFYTEEKFEGLMAGVAEGYRVYLLQPAFLGILILEIRKADH